MAGLVKMTCMVAEGADVSEFNKAYEATLAKVRHVDDASTSTSTTGGGTPEKMVETMAFPARSTMIVKALPMGAKVMIDAIGIQNVE
jgi:enamine deaminase RidA (YjgF/YER057c/UK114 family)